MTSTVGRQGVGNVTVTLSNMHPYAGIFVDWKETVTAHVFKADLPGLRKEVVRVEVDEYRMLAISMPGMREKVQQADMWHRVERSSGHVLSRLRIPENVNLEAIVANLASGVLTVVVPKVDKQSPHTWSIDIAEEAITQDDNKACVVNL